MQDKEPGGRRVRLVSGMAKPMGLAEYQLLRALPETLDSSLPTVEQLEEELDASLKDEKQGK